MKLLYVIHQYFPQAFSGTEQYCLAVSREARRRGDEVVVLSLVPDFGCEEPLLHLYDEPYDGFTVLRLRHWWGLQPNELLRDYENPLVAERFRQVLADVAPDAIHFFHLRNLGSDFLEVARDAGVRSIVHLMDYWYLCPRFTLQRTDGSLCEGPPDGGLGCIPCHYPELQSWLGDDAGDRAVAMANALTHTPQGTDAPARFASLIRRKTVLLERLALADVVFAPSQFLADMFAKNGFAHDGLQVVPYGLEPDRVDRIEVQRPRHPLRVGFAGMLSPWKGPRIAVDAVLALDGPIQLKVHGPTGEPEFREYIDAMIEAAAGDERIEFCGPYGREQLGQALADMDLIAVPSTWYENTPFVILEAMEAGVPVIAADLGGMSELIVEGQNGFLFPSNDAAGLAAVLQRCLDDPTLVAGLRVTPPGRIADNYDVFREAYRPGHG